MTKPWIELAAVSDDAIPAQLGVFQLADAELDVVYIGYAGGRQLFGMRTAVAGALDRLAAAGVEAAQLRYELTHAYLSRWEELLMVHHHDHGQLPIANPASDHPGGTLTPSGTGPSGPIPPTSG